jgi:hypothetical protein
MHFCPAALPGRLAQQPFPAAFPGSLARKPCPEALPDRKTDFYYIGTFKIKPDRK